MRWKALALVSLAALVGAGLAFAGAVLAAAVRSPWIFALVLTAAVAAVVLFAWNQLSQPRPNVNDLADPDSDVEQAMGAACSRYCDAIREDLRRHATPEAAHRELVAIRYWCATRPSRRRRLRNLITVARAWGHEKDTEFVTGNRLDPTLLPRRARRRLP